MSREGADAPPSDVRPISWQELGRLGIDSHNRLHWDGRMVEVRRRLVLTRFQQAVALAVSAAAILGGLGAAASGVKDGAEFLCGRGHASLCPAERR